MAFSEHRATDVPALGRHREAPNAAPSAEGKRCLLLADGQDDTLLPILRLLTAQNFIVTIAAGGGIDGEPLAFAGEDCDLIIIDRKGPNHGGPDPLGKIRAVDGLAHIPVIMLAHAADDDGVRQALDRRACYFIAKPFEAEILASVASAAADQHAEWRRQRQRARQAERPMALLAKGVFHFRSLDDARMIARVLAQSCPNPERSQLGIEELLVNAVEHGNLGIGYEEKTRLVAAGTWKDEVMRRLETPAGRARLVRVTFERLPDGTVRLEVQDDGDGFDWRRYCDFDSRRALDNHGRGIAMARLLSFDTLHYLGNGNTAVATIRPMRP